MNTKPSPMKLSATRIPLSFINISGDHLVHLDVCMTSLEELPEVMRDAPQLKACSLTMIEPSPDDFPFPKAIVRLPHLRALELYWIDDIKVSNKFINSLELPSLELWVIESRSILDTDVMVSFLKRSACTVKTLRLEWEAELPAAEDFGRFLS